MRHPTSEVPIVSSADGLDSGLDRFGRNEDNGCSMGFAVHKRVVSVTGASGYLADRHPPTSTVNVERLSCDIRGIIAEEESDSGCDLLRSRAASHDA